MLPENNGLDYTKLLKIRTVVARMGEMDKGRWWNTQGVLGRRGGVVFKRGFPKTQWFTRLGIVLAVARHRCQELFHPAGVLTLWHLPADVEDAFEDHWLNCLNSMDNWIPFFESISNMETTSLLDALFSLNLITSNQVDQVVRLKPTADNLSVALPKQHAINMDTLVLLAGAFSLSELGRPVVPFVPHFDS
jgi:hypothetical protein